MAVGFGLLLGLVVGWSRSIYAGLYPLMIGFNAIPKVAVVPILVLWFGIGFIPAVLTAFLISFFPIVVNVATGLATIEPELEDVLKALGASKLDIMRKVGIPRTLPYFFGSLKVAITLAFVGSVISESVASNYGIGNLMLQAQAQFQVPLIFAGLIALAVEGIVMYWLMAMLEARMTGWAQRSLPRALLMCRASGRKPRLPLLLDALWLSATRPGGSLPECRRLRRQSRPRSVSTSLISSSRFSPSPKLNPPRNLVHAEASTGFAQA